MTSSPDAAWAPLALPTVAGPARPRPAETVSWLPELTNGAAPAAAAPAPPGQDYFLQGYADGLRDGTAAAADEVRVAVEALGKVAAVLQVSQEEFAHERERALTALALAVARKLVQRELEAEPATLQGLIARALEMLPLDTTLDVRLHPADLAALGERREALTPPGRGLTLQWLADPTLARGDFIVDSARRLVDGRLDAALQSLYERLGDG